jgi:hypothetical protein
MHSRKGCPNRDYSTMPPAPLGRDPRKWKVAWARTQSRAEKKQAEKQAAAELAAEQAAAELAAEQAAAEQATETKRKRDSLAVDPVVSPAAASAQRSPIGLSAAASPSFAETQAFSPSGDWDAPAPVESELSPVASQPAAAEQEDTDDEDVS